MKNEIDRKLVLAWGFLQGVLVTFLNVYAPLDLSGNSMNRS